MKKPISLPISLSLVLSLHLVGHYSWAATEPKSCQTVLAYTQDEVANAQKLSGMVMNEITKSSRKTLAQLRKSSQTFDVICLGAGPQCAAASLTLAKSSLKSLVVEKSSTVASNFAEKDFMINSAETDDISMHKIPGAKIEFSQLISNKYANSQQLAAYIQAVQLQSQVPVLLNTEVIHFETRIEGGQTAVVLKTNNGLELKTRHLLIGTGLGVADTKIPTPLYRKMFRQSLAQADINPAELQTVMNTETFMRALKVDPTRKRKVVLPKTIAIIGNGDGSRIAVEELSESFVVIPEGFKIFWIGNDFQNSEQYKASQKGWDRYIEKVAAQYDKNHIQGIPGYAVDAELLESGRLKFKVEDPTTKAVQFVEVDMAIDSTGYDNQILKIMNSDLGQVSLKDIKGQLQERNQPEVNVARQVIKSDGQALPVYMIGASSGPLLTKEQMAELKNRNPVSIYNNAPLTAQFVAQLIGVEPYPRDLGHRTTRKNVQSADTLFEMIKK